MDNMHIITITEEKVNQFEEENRMDVVMFILEVVVNALGESEVNEQKVDEVVSKWFEKHKNDETFAEELTKFVEVIQKRIKRCKKDWKK